MTLPSDDLAILFPGQGVGDAGRRAIWSAPQRPDLLELAGELVGDDPFARIADGTRFAQPAIYCASLAGFERLGRPAAARLRRPLARRARARWPPPARSTTSTGCGSRSSAAG